MLAIAAVRISPSRAWDSPAVLISRTYVVQAAGHVGSLLAILLKDTSRDYVIVQSPLILFYGSAMAFDVTVRVGVLAVLSLQLFAQFAAYPRAAVVEPGAPDAIERRGDLIVVGSKA